MMQILKRLDHRLIFVIFTCLAIAIFSQNLNILSVEYRDDEVRYFKSTKEMLKTGNFMWPTLMGENRFQKPILYYWLILLSYKLFGVSWFSARFVASVLGAMTVGLTWLIGKELFDKKTAFLGAVLLMATPFFFRHAQNAVPDMPLNFFIVLAFYYAIRFISDPDRKRYPILFFTACGLGFMIKGFPALVVPITSLVIYAAATKRAYLLKKINFPLGIFLLAVIILPWFLYMISVHGETYFHHVVGTEVQGRIFDENQTNIFWGMLKVFNRNVFYYLSNLMPYCAPWSLCFWAAVPLGLYKVFKKEKGYEPVLFLLIWFFVVYVFFSLVAETKHHYLLILTTPFALLVSCFFLQEAPANLIMRGVLAFLRKYYILFVLLMGFFIFAFLTIFMLQANPLWFIVYGGVLAFLTVGILKIQNRMFAPLALSIFLIFVLGQSKLLADAGLSSHGTLQKLAKTIHQDIGPETIIMTGSYDIHENEVQVYFDRPVIKGGWDTDERTQETYKEYFVRPGPVYCIILEKDYETIFPQNARKNFAKIEEEFIIRKRLNLDQGFMRAFFSFNRAVVRSYLLEKVILLKKDRQPDHDA